jgi:hypothetical protein
VSDLASSACAAFPLLRAECGGFIRQYSPLVFAEVESMADLQACVDADYCDHL